MSVVAESAKRKEDGVVVISKQKLISKASDLYAYLSLKEMLLSIFNNNFLSFSSVYELPFYDTKIPRGFYTVYLTLTARNERKLIGLTDNIVSIKIICLKYSKVIRILD